MATHLPELGDAELEVLKALWDAGPGTVRQVLQHLHDRGRKVAYTTVLTVLSRLEQKGYVASDKSGLAYIYKPRVSRQKVVGSRLKAVVEQLYDGAAAPLVLHLMESQRFTPEEIEQLQRLIKRLDKDA
jgi:BlaI family transcriptional regulator, penicillinase repressor